MAYYLRMWDECGSEHRIELGGNEIDGPPAGDVIERECEEWCRDGEWGNDGARIHIGWELTDEDDETVDRGGLYVTIEPDHDALIDAAGGDTDCDHIWTSEGEGGCRENPGVWSVGGTAMVFLTHCRKCGLQRRERTTGSQRNPGEHDTVEYTQPESWCAECEREECECVTEDA